MHKNRYKGIDLIEKTIGPITFKPYDALVIGRDGYAKEFPVIFDWANIKDGCIWYTGD